MLAVFTSPNRPKADGINAHRLQARPGREHKDDALGRVTPSVTPADTSAPGAGKDASLRRSAPPFKYRKQTESARSPALPASGVCPSTSTTWRGKSTIGPRAAKRGDTARVVGLYAAVHASIAALAEKTERAADQLYEVMAERRDS